MAGKSKNAPLLATGAAGGARSQGATKVDVTRRMAADTGNVVGADSATIMGHGGDVRVTHSAGAGGKPVRS